MREDKVIRAIGEAFRGSIAAALTPPKQCEQVIYYPGAKCGSWVVWRCPNKEGHSGSHTDLNFVPISDEDIMFFARQWELCNA